MKIYALMENTPYAPQFAPEHGLSLYIETDRHRLLFDAGATGAFADNAERLGVDLSRVELAVLSHDHYDHGGGLARFLELNSRAPVYLSEHAFGRRYDAGGRYIGIDPALRESGRLQFVGDRLELDDQLTLYACNGEAAIYPLDSAGLTEERDGARYPDRFLHEQYLMIREKGKKVLISGCSHKGILNIMHWLEPDVLVGGFHFMKQEVGPGGNPVLDTAARALLEHGARYYTCHCTGQAPFDYLKERMGDALQYLASGQVITI